MNQEFYADKVSNIYVNATTVRVDFASLNPAAPDKEGSPVYTETIRLIMPLTGFTEAFSLSHHVIGQLIEKGVLTFVPPQPLPTASQPEMAEALTHEK